MSALSSIEWTDRTWNPVRGCSVISPGCVNCYAMKFAHRFSGAGKPYEGLTKQTKAGPQWTGKVALVGDALVEPLKWRKPARVFVNSMSDLFHDAVPDEFIDRVFAVMSLASRHTFQILTKRPERMRAYMTSAPAAPSCSRETAVNGAIWSTLGTKVGSTIEHGGHWRCRWPLPNVWLGVSVENQATADARIPLLLETPALVRFVSYEPALGPIDFLRTPRQGCHHDWLTGERDTASEHGSTARLGWVIVGAESGPGARPFDVAWARTTVQRCKDAGVPVFVKQLGAKPLVPACRQSHWDYGRFLGAPEHRRFRAHDGETWVMRLASRKGANPSEWPEDLRVREFPMEHA